MTESDALRLIRDFVASLGGHDGDCAFVEDSRCPTCNAPRTACVHHQRLFAERRAAALSALDRLEGVRG